MELEMSMGSMKSDWEFGIMAGLLHLGTFRKTALENIYPQFLGENGQNVNSSTVFR